MKKLLFSLCLILFTCTFSFAQPFPDSGKDFVIRGNWNAYQNTIKMTKSPENLYTYQQSLSKLNGNAVDNPYAYQYTIPFQNPAWGGRINPLEREFTLAADQLVTFYAKAFTSDGGATYWTKYICDAQPVIFLFPALSSPNNIKVLPLPVNGKSSAIVTLPSSATLIYEVVVKTKNNNNAWEDLNNTAANDRPLYPAGGGGGRYKLLVDYTTISSSTAKVLDNIDSPLIKVGIAGTPVAPSDASFAGNNLGTFNNSSALKIGASLKAYSLKQAVNITDVAAKLYYRITKTGYDSGTKELVLSASGTITSGTVFTNTSDLVVSSGLVNGDYTLKVWYGTSCFEDELLIDNVGAGYSASFTVLNELWSGSHWSGNGNWSDEAGPTSGADVIVDNGELTIDQSVNVTSITVMPGAKLTLKTDNTLTVNGNIVIKNNATFVDNGTVNNLGTSTVEQNIIGGRNWYIASPVTGATNNVVLGTSGNKLYSYNEVGASWNQLTISGDALSSMRGYIAQPLIDGTLSFTGQLITGTQSLSLARTENISEKRGFNLVGNPYPSYINWSSSYSVSTDIEPTMWYRTQNGSSAYVFDTYGAVSGIGTMNNGTSITAFIPPMQAFWVRVAETKTSGVFAVSNAMRTHETGTNRLKVRSATNTSQQVLRLQVSNGTNSDEAIVLFNANASNGYDTYDSPKMSNNNVDIPEIYTTVGTDNMVINGLNSVISNQILPLGFTTGTPNTFTIKATEVNNFETNTKIVLKDNLLNKEQELTVGNSYTFSSDVTNTNNRFSLEFKTATISTGINTTEDQTVLFYKNGNSQIAINSNNIVGKEGIVSIYNALGQLLISTTTTGVNTVINRTFSSGLYLVTLKIAGKYFNGKVIFN